VAAPQQRAEKAYCCLVSRPMPQYTVGPAGVLLMGSMKHVHFSLKTALLTCVIGLSLVSGALAQTSPSTLAGDDKTVATVNGYEIKTSEVRMAFDDVIGQLPNMPVNTIAYEKSAKNALYVGTDAGVYYRNDTLSHWVPYKSGLPNVIVDDLQIQYPSKTISAATYGRGIWQAPLRP